MRPIQVSTDVYAAIWAARQMGEDSEDAILRRLLKAPAPPTEKVEDVLNPGFVDQRHGISLREGFEIFRMFKGQRVRALAMAGKWVIPETGEKYSSLNLLSQAVTGNNENTWRNWYFLQDGKRVLIDALRRPRSLNG